ncbi:MAG TPA: hypothetical protein DGM69_06735 [Chloroflexi bacterium]|nr:hypothetical protein [Chloroflexota bacterium]|tara:strand:+ start:163 stop:1821 length:1659 start_codon:yes stop_codon:yes gene_type:complete
MYTLLSTYLQYDLTLLTVIATTAGIEINANNQRDSAIELAELMQNPNNLAINCAGIGQEAHKILKTINSSNGRMTVSSIHRNFGAIRPLGPEAIKREQPQLDPANSVETLWYHGLIGRAFDDHKDAQEYYYIPSELRPLLPHPKQKMIMNNSIYSIASKKQDIILAKTTLVDDICTTLAFLRNWNKTKEYLLSNYMNSPINRLYPYLHHPKILPMTVTLLQELGCWSESSGILSSENIRKLLNDSRAQQLYTLATTWYQSYKWIDLFSVPKLQFNDFSSIRTNSQSVRKYILSKLEQCEGNQWINLEKFIDNIHGNDPDFQRVSGDYESWYIVDQSTDKPLIGFKNWHNIEGALIRHMITHTLHIMGMIDITNNKELFRLNKMFGQFMNNKPWSINDSEEFLAINDEGLITAFCSSNRADRYLASRLGTWEKTRDKNIYRYRICANKLSTAIDQGFSANQICSFLQRSTNQQIPHTIIKAIQEWANNNTSATLSKVTIITFNSVTTLKKFLNSPQTKKYVDEQIGPLTVQVRYNNSKKLYDAMMKIGILLED